MAVPGIDVFLREHMAAFLADAGYVKDKRVYRAKDADGNTLLVDFDVARFAPHSVVAFVVRAGIHIPVPRPWLSAELQAEVASKRIGIEDAQYSVTLLPPVEYGLEAVSGSPGRGAWVLPPGAEGASAVASALRDGLEEHVLPVLLRARAGERDSDSFRDPALTVSTACKPFSWPAVWN